VLNGKQRQQHQIDDQSLHRRRSRPAVDRLGHNQLRDKANGVQKSDEKDEIREHAKPKREAARDEGITSPFWVSD